MYSMGTKLNLVGLTSGELTVVSETNERDSSSGSVLWECKCSCGNTSYVRASALKRQRILSCGKCVKVRFFKLTKSKLLCLDSKGSHFIIDKIDYLSVCKHNWTVIDRFGYVVGYVNKLNVKLHRYLLNIYNPEIYVDHKDRRPRNNSRRNLRVATIYQNQQNRKPIHGKSSKYKGVYWNKQRKYWTVSLQHNNKRIYVGKFYDEVEGAKAYDRKAKELYGDFSYLNFKETKK